jgi:hypothetical protein
MHELASGRLSIAFDYREVARRGGLRRNGSRRVPIESATVERCYKLRRRLVKIIDEMRR